MAMNEDARRERNRAAAKRHYAKKKAEGRVRGDVFRAWRDANLERYLLANARQRARLKGLAFDITLDDIVIPDVCPVLGIPLFPGRQNDRDNSPSLDRRDPTLGYVPGNVEVISWRANKLKSDGTLDEFRRLMAWMSKP